MATLRIVMSAWRGRSRRGSSCALAQEAVPDTTQRAWAATRPSRERHREIQGDNGENTFTGTVKSQTTVTSVRLTGTQTD